ncbi:hypothetical protein D3C71_1622350 [compost metagenome]
MPNGPAAAPWSVANAGPRCVRALRSIFKSWAYSLAGPANTWGVMVDVSDGPNHVHARRTWAVVSTMAWHTPRMISSSLRPRISLAERLSSISAITDRSRCGSNASDAADICVVADGDDELARVGGFLKNMARDKAPER